MAFNYDTNIKNIILSMSLSPYLPTGSSVGYGFKMTYDEGATSSFAGAITIYDEGILSTGTASLQIFVPTSSYLDRGFTSQSISQLVTQYTDFPTGRADETISTQVIYAPGEITTDACSVTCYQGENYYSTFDLSTVFLPGTYTNLANRQTTRPLKGGVSITSTSKCPPYGPGSMGTMGLVCQDSASGALVGLTNNHVVIRDAFYTSQRTYTNPQNEFDLTDSSNTIQGDFVYQTGEITPTNPTVNPGGAEEIGRVMRYVPIYTSASIVANPSLVNKVDGAIFSLYCTSSTGATIIDFTSSFQQVGLTYTSSMPFASTAEIDDLINNNYELFSSGRTTGPKGSPSTLCPLRMYGYASFPIAYSLQGTPTLSYFTDVLMFVKPNDSSSFSPTTPLTSATLCPYPVWGGDSGSTLIANIGGTWKIVGLVFAGNGENYNPQTGLPNVNIGGMIYPLQVASSIGYACRIDQVASQLGIKAWTGSAAPVVDHSTIVYKTVSGSNSNKTLVCSGSTYWQVGLTEKHNIC
jgi:hypothetical protein